MMNKFYKTYFIDDFGNLLGDFPEILPIPLYKNMKITIHGHTGDFLVVEWMLCYGHPDENSGLTIVLKKAKI